MIRFETGMKNSNTYATINESEITFIEQRGLFYYIHIHNESICCHRSEELDSLCKKMLKVSPTIYLWEDADIIIRNHSILDYDEIPLSDNHYEILKKDKILINDICNNEFICKPNRIFITYEEKEFDRLILKNKREMGRTQNIEIHIEKDSQIKAL